MAKSKHSRRSSKKNSSKNAFRRWRNLVRDKLYGDRAFIEKHSQAITRIYEQEDNSMERVIESTKKLMTVRD